jgi:acyl transferase domain-containing protein/acyl carrier protein
MTEPLDGKSGAEPIAVIGMACRVPGGAKTPGAFWNELRDGVDAIEDVPVDRWDAAAFYSPDPEEPGKTYVRKGGFIQEVDRFDPQFFGITHKEANTMDPQQRLLLELTWEALENAGQSPEELRGSRTAVLIGMCGNDYSQIMLSSGYDRLAGHMASGSAHSIAAGRLSYFFGLEGPCLTVDTACSSSLATAYMAYQSLTHGECDLAIAGGVNLVLAPELMVVFSKMKMLSPDGRCKTFDASANGYVRSDGCGIVVLKRRADALRDHDRILALIRGGAINQDGRSGGLTVPNGAAQQSLLREALANSGVGPGEVTYIETHGTGTPLGDPIEVNAIGAVFGATHDAHNPVFLGSVKANLGHLEGAAGITSLIKTVLVLQHREIPPNIHFKNPNPNIPWASLPVRVPTTSTPWSPNCGVRVAGISAFGFSGTNVHLLVQEAPVADSKSAEPERPLHVLPLSAKSESALRQVAGRFSRYLETSPESVPDICYTASVGRSHFAHRVAIVAGSGEELRTKLTAFSAAQELHGIRRGTVSAGVRNKVAFLFTGQGSHYPEMGRRLYETEPVFRRCLEQCDAWLKPEIGESIVSLIAGAGDLAQTALAQPTLFSFDYALARMWMSWGIQPAAVMGHSLGEYVAACVAGVFSLEDGLRLVAARGRLMQSVASPGQMIAVSATAGRVAPFISAYQAKVSVAAFNGPGNLVLSGPDEEITVIASALRAAGIGTHKLQVRTAFHSPLMDPILDAFEAAARSIPFSPARIPFVSNVTGRAIAPGETLDARYWRIHLRSPVRFESGVRALVERGCGAFLEIGPGTTLLGMAGKCLSEGDRLLLPSLRPNREDWEQVLETVAALYARGFPVDWKAFDRGRSRSKVELPGYPFERKRCWFEEGGTNSARYSQAVPARQVKRDEWKNWLYEVQWTEAAGTAGASDAATGEGPSKWLILADRAGVGRNLAQLLVAQGRSAELLYKPSSMAELQEAVRTRAVDDCHAIVHMWSLDAGDGSHLNLANLESAQELTCETLLNVLQPLTGRKTSTGPKIWAVTAGAQRVSKLDQISPAQSLTWGFGRTIGLEYPDLWGGLIDLPPDASPDAQARLIVGEIAGAGAEDQVAFRNGARYVPRLIPAATEESTLPSFAVNPAAAYLITGGMGKLGIRIARWLTDLGARHLVLTGRRELKDVSPAAAAAIDALRARGCRIDALPVDTSDDAQMRELSEHLRHGPPVAGIVAAAGAFSRAPLDCTEFSSWMPTLRTKVAGTWLLSELARDLNPDFFVLFSSITSLLGTQNLAHYAAACQFQDAFAAQRRSFGQHALTINWGMWEETGGDSESERVFRLSGNRPMESAEAFSALNYLLTAGETQKTVASIDWAILKPLYETRKRKPFLESIATPVENRAGAVAAVKRGELRSRFEAAPPQDRAAIVELSVVRIVARALGAQVGSIPLDQNFAEMGMDSLMAQEMRNSLQTEAGLELPNTLSYEYSTLRVLSDYVTSRLDASVKDAGIDSAEDRSGSRIEPASRTVKRTEFPLSPPQENFGYLYQDNVAFNIPLPYRLTGTLDIRAVELALAEIVNRHEALRTSFSVKNGAPVQVVSDSAHIRLSIEDLSDLPQRQPGGIDLQRRVAKCSETAFDLAIAPLLRVWLFKLGEADWVLLFVAHHLVFDAWSMKVMVREFEALYNAFAAGEPSPLPPLEIQYVDFSEWQRNRIRIDDELEYWRQQFGSKILDLPFPKNGDSSVAKGEKCRVVLPLALMDRLKRASGEASQTLFTLMFAAFGLLIHHYSGEDDILMLSAGAGRTMRETEGLIGMFATPLLVRARFSADPPFLALLEQVRSSFMGAASHHLPVQRLMESFGMSGQGNSRVLSQVFFDSLPEVPINLHLKGLENAAYFPTERERMRHDLELYTRPVPTGMYCAMWCNRSLFDSSIPQRMMEDFKLVLERIADKPADRIGALLQGIPEGLACREKV